MKTSKNLRFKSIEKILAPRLQLLGFIMLGFSSLMLVYALMSAPYVSHQNDFETPLAMEETSGISSSSDTPFLSLTDEERGWSYAVVAVFAALGFTLIFFAKKKKKESE